MLLCSVSVALALASSLSAATASSPSVSISNGTVQGGQCTNNPNSVYFKSIPFAQPPIGDLRFAPPQPYAQKYPSGTLNATQPAPACPQFGDPNQAERGPTSEDCLLLDIWASANATASSALPVRVWLYGGSNMAGGISNPLYDQCNVPDTNAIAVSLNYRLGPLGFLALDSADFGGNQAVLDQLLGLQWVQENIAAFGGDPKRVVVHGQSAGATDAFILATLPQAPTLMSAAIMQSGGGGDVGSSASQQTLGVNFAKWLNCSISDAICLRSKSVSDLQKAFLTLPMLNSMKLPELAVDSAASDSFRPYIDGKIVSQQPSTAGVQVPSVFGFTSMDGYLFALFQYATDPKGPAAATAADYTQFLAENFGPAAVPTIQKYYPLSSFNATPYPPFFAIATVLTAASYQCPAARGLNTAAAHGVPVWAYDFAHQPQCSWQPGLPDAALPLLGATHTAEIPFVFGITEHLPPPNGTCSMSPEERGISAFMNAAWTSMAARQRPGDANAWPAYDAQKSLGVNIGNASVPGLVNFTQCRLWDQINQQIVAAAFNGSANGTTGVGSNVTAGVGSPTAPINLGSTSGGSKFGAATDLAINAATALLFSMAVVKLMDV